MTYERIDIYRRFPSGSELVVYRCLRLLSGHGYVVQSADRIRLPVMAGTLVEHEKQFCELLAEEAPEVRSTPYPTLEEAIRAFDEYFGNFG